jgi:hypothetical protein
MGCEISETIGNFGFKVHIVPSGKEMISYPITKNVPHQELVV